MSKSKRPSASGLRNPRFQIFAGALVVVAVASGALAWSLTGSGDHASPAPSPEPTVSESPGQQFANGVLKDFSNMTTVIVGFLGTLQDWRADKADDVQMAAIAKIVLADAVATQQALAARQPFPQAPQALENYRHAAGLYVQAAALTGVATAVPRGDLRTQLQLAISRVQTLGDRVFDQAIAELKPFTQQDRAVAGVQITPANEVPNFAFSSLAAGPPLTKVSASSSPRPYEETRPEQSFAQWARLIGTAGIPAVKDEEAAIDKGRTTVLSAESNTFTAASDLLYGKPDPKGERLVGTRTQLALLVQAEATQMAHAATLVPPAQHDRLLHIAQALALIGDKLWDPRLGARTSSYPDSILTSDQK